jgi:predicted transcriptional regulator
MLSKLPPRERQIVDILYERGPVLVSEICEILPDQLSGPSRLRAWSAASRERSRLIFEPM